MDKRTVYPGRSWLVEYGGPETDWPTYLVARIYRTTESIAAARWTVIDAAKVARYARSGNYLEAVTATLTRHADKTYVATCLVAVDTARRSDVIMGRFGPMVDATVLTVDGGWEVYHDAQSWELRGLGGLMDAVQTVINRVAEARLKVAHAPVTPSLSAKTVQVWYCEECQTANVNDHDACVACGLIHTPQEERDRINALADKLGPSNGSQLSDDDKSRTAAERFHFDNVCVKCGKPFVAADGALMGIGDCCQIQPQPTNS